MRTIMRCRKGSTISESMVAQAGDIQDLSSLQASTLLLRNTLVTLKGEP